MAAKDTLAGAHDAHGESNIPGSHNREAASKVMDNSILIDAGNKQDCYTTLSKFRADSWPHRDQKMEYLEERDHAHKRDCPVAFDEPKCIQSSLYLTACNQPENQTFAFCPGSHRWPDMPGWENAINSHRVTVDSDSIANRAVKVMALEGDLILWYSKTIHWGHPGVSTKPNTKGKSGIVSMPMWRVERNRDDTDGIRECLDMYGACVVPGLIDGAEVLRLKRQFVEDANLIFVPDEPFADWKQVSTCGTGKGGSATPALTLSKWAWETRLHPARVSLFRRLLGTDDVCVSLDSVHWSPSGDRLCSMASFSPKHLRSDEAFKMKCVTAAWGKWRMTHWAAHGTLSTFCYGFRTQRESNYKAIHPSWRGWAASAAADEIISRINGASSPMRIPALIREIARQLDTDEATALVRGDIVGFL